LENLLVGDNYQPDRLASAVESATAT